MAGGMWHPLFALGKVAPSASAYSIIAFALLTAVVLTAAVFDWRTRRIPDWLMIGGIAGGIALAGVMGFIEAGGGGLWANLKNAGGGLLAGFVPAFLIFMAGALHGGDVKLFAAIGAIAADWEVVLGSAFYGFIFAGLLAVVIMIKKGIVRDTLRRIANAALMTAAKVKAELDGPQSPQIPLAVPVALGTILAGIEFMLRVRMPWN